MKLLRETIPPAVVLLYVVFGFLSDAAEPIEKPIAPAPDADSSPEGGAAAAIAFLGHEMPDGDISRRLKMGIRAAPHLKAWTVTETGEILTAAVRELPADPERSRLTPSMLQIARMLAMRELVLSKAATAPLVDLGLSDEQTLREAMAARVGSIRMEGFLAGVEFRAGVQDDYCVALARGDVSSITASLVRPSSLAAIRDGYRQVMRQRMKVHMHRTRLTEAISTGEHLRGLNLGLPSLCLDLARLYQMTENPEASLRMLEETMNRYGRTTSSRILEQVGDLACRLPNKTGASMAKRAYNLASERLQNQVIPLDAMLGLPGGATSGPEDLESDINHP
jgi:hypothetical protein